jgi:hypothetical protein
MHSNSSMLRKEDQILSQLHRSSLGLLLVRGVQAIMVSGYWLKPLTATASVYAVIITAG